MVSEAKNRTKVIKMPKKIGGNFTFFRMFFALLFFLFLCPNHVLSADEVDGKFTGLKNDLITFQMPVR